MEAIAASLTFTAQEDGVLAVAVDPAGLQTALGDELAVFGSGAQDARFEVSGGAVTVVPSVDGTGVAPATLAEQLLPVLTEPAPRTVTAQLGPVPADFTTEEAQALGITEEIGSFTTNIGNPASGENIRVVAAEVDGAIVMPGETFSLNTSPAPRHRPGLRAGRRHQRRPDHPGRGRRHQPVRDDDVQRGLLLRPRGHLPQAAQLLHQPLPGRPRGDGLRGPDRPAVAQRQRHRRLHRHRVDARHDHRDVLRDEALRDPVDQQQPRERPRARGAGEAGRRHLQAAGRVAGFRHHRHPRLPRPLDRRGGAARGLPDALRGGADHPVHPATRPRPPAPAPTPGG